MVDGNGVRMVDAAGNSATYTAGNGITTYTYDGDNRPLSAITMVGGVQHLVMTWQYDAVGNNTYFQKVTDGLVTTAITKQFDSASANTFTRTETRKPGADMEGQEVTHSRAAR